MKLHTQDRVGLGEKIAEADAKLARLEKEIGIIGQPAAQDLTRRLDALKIEERALKRNFREAEGMAGHSPAKIEKITTLLHHIECEETSVEQDASFLSQAAPSSMILAIQAGAHVIKLYRQGAKRVLGNHHPLGSSAFVNHSHEDLETESGLKPRMKTARHLEG